MRIIISSTTSFVVFLFLWTLSFAAGPQWIKRTFGPFNFQYPETEEKLVIYLGSYYKKIENRIAEDLGLLHLGEIQVTIVSTQEDFTSLQPAGKRAQQWAAALAYPEQGKILMKTPKLLLGGQPDYKKIFIHEVTHIALYRALQQKHEGTKASDSPPYSDKISIPLWLHEGYAIYMAREWSPNREVLLTRAVLQRRIIPLGRLVGAFPAEEHLARLAYAESADLIHYLINTFGEDAFQHFIDFIGRGYHFGHACRKTYGLELYELEERWKKHLKRRYSWIPLVSSTGMLWFLTAIILIGAYGYKKMTARATLARWEEEEPD